jgi:hypothetical protein
VSAALLLAALILVLLAAVHSILGERYLIVRLLRREDLPPLLGGTQFTKGILRFAWHITSVAWLGLAGVLVAIMPSGSVAEGTVLRIISLTAMVTGGVVLVGSRGRHFAWAAFLVVAALIWMAS